METVKFNAQELCSRKLWQLAIAETSTEFDDYQLSDVIAELTKRRHYLEKLQENGILGQHGDN